MNRWKWLLFLALLVGFLRGGEVAAASGMPVTDQDRCAVCGMFVAKYPEWVTQIGLKDGRVLMFDGPKDMLVFYFSPEEYGEDASTIEHIMVKDYYTQQWLDGRSAHYVTGSDVYGPMGEEFVPFDSRKAAENFLKDHHGKIILLLEDITPTLVQDMQKGHKMKMHKQ